MMVEHVLWHIALGCAALLLRTRRGIRRHRSIRSTRNIEGRSSTHQLRRRHSPGAAGYDRRGISVWTPKAARGSTIQVSMLSSVAPKTAGFTGYERFLTQLARSTPRKQELPRITIARRPASRERAAD
jgi:hypothetical protein